MIRKLLKLDKKLIVFKNVKNEVCIQYKDCSIKDGFFLKDEYGCGENLDEAIVDYLNKISGKTLVFGCDKNREEVKVLL